MIDELYSLKKRGDYTNYWFIERLLSEEFVIVLFFLTFKALI